MSETKLPLTSLDAALVRQVASGGRMSGNDAETLHAIANAIDSACEASETCGVFLKSNATTQFEIGALVYIQGEVLGQSPDLQRVNVGVKNGVSAIYDVEDCHVFLDKNVTEQPKGSPSPAEAEKMAKCATCGHIDPEHGFTGPCEADWGKCPCKRFVEPTVQAQGRVEITDEMVVRFNKTWARLHWQGVKHANVTREQQVREALEAAFNG